MDDDVARSVAECLHVCVGVCLLTAKARRGEVDDEAAGRGEALFGDAKVVDHSLARNGGRSRDEGRDAFGQGGLRTCDRCCA